MEGIDATLTALADPTRRAILARLAQGEATVMEIAAGFPISQPAISRHLKVLERADLVRRRVDGTRRPCRLSPTGLATLEAYLEQLRAGLEKNYARLDALLAKSTDDEETSR